MKLPMLLLCMVSTVAFYTVSAQSHPATPPKPILGHPSLWFHGKTPVFAAQPTSAYKSGSSKNVDKYFLLNWDGTLKTWSDTQEYDTYVAYYADGTPKSATLISYVDSEKSEITSFKPTPNTKNSTGQPKALAFYQPCEGTYYSMKNGKWVLNGRSIVTKRDAGQNILEFKNQSLQNGVWADDNIFEYHYNAAGQQDSSTFYKSTGGNIVPNSRTTNFFYKTLYAGQMVETWNGTKWVLSPQEYIKYDFIEDAKGRVDSFKEYVYSNYLQKVSIAYVQTYWYDANNQISAVGLRGYDTAGKGSQLDSFTNFSWQSFDPLWQTDQSDYFYYYKTAPFYIGGNGYKSYSRVFYSNDSGRMLTYDKYTQAFDANGKITESDYYHKPSYPVGLAPVSKHTYTYLPGGYPNVEMDYVWKPQLNAFAVITGNNFTRLVDADGDLVQEQYSYYDTLSKKWINSQKDSIVYQNFTGVANQENDRETLIYPNPATSTLNILDKNDAITKLTVYNMEGKLILTQFPERASTSIDVSGLSKGLYVIYLQTDRGVFEKKFVR